jgi:hypothetical protein
MPGLSTISRDLATLILLACHRSAKGLAEIAPLISQYCSEEDREALKLPLENVTGYVAERCPEVQAELEARHDRYGRTVQLRPRP